MSLDKKEIKKITNHKSLNVYLKRFTNKEFFLTNTKSNLSTIIITRDNKLIVFQESLYYFSWLSEDHIKTYLEFINQD